MIATLATNKNSYKKHLVLVHCGREALGVLCGPCPTKHWRKTGKLDPTSNIYKTSLVPTVWEQKKHL
jgi:hypothetical protein